MQSARAHRGDLRPVPWPHAPVRVVASREEPRNEAGSHRDRDHGAETDGGTRTLGSRRAGAVSDGGHGLLLERRPERLDHFAEVAERIGPVVTLEAPEVAYRGFALVAVQVGDGARRFDVD